MRTTLPGGSLSPIQARYSYVVCLLRQSSIMAIEIERKFLVRDESWRQGVRGWWFIKQGYFARTALLRARVRIFGDKGFVTFKSEPGTRVRYEFEYEIPHADALEIIRRFSIEPLIVKTRHEILYADKLWWVDVFAGANQGLLVAEVELNHPDESLSIPEWIGEEVTNDRRYGNSNLARHPFVTWGLDEGGAHTDLEAEA
jgi:adenylate cyclase